MTLKVYLVPENDPTLWPDILALYRAITDRIGVPAFVEWLKMEHPYLEKPTTKLIRVWWIMQRYHDELMGIEHRGWCIVTPDALLVPAPRGWGGGTGEGVE